MTPDDKTILSQIAELKKLSFLPNDVKLSIKVIEIYKDMRGTRLDQINKERGLVVECSNVIERCFKARLNGNTNESK